MAESQGPAAPRLRAGGGPQGEAVVLQLQSTGGSLPSPCPCPSPLLSSRSSKCQPRALNPIPRPAGSPQQLNRADRPRSPSGEGRERPGLCCRGLANKQTVSAQLVAGDSGAAPEGPTAPGAPRAAAGLTEARGLCGRGEREPEAQRPRAVCSAAPR